MDKVISQEVKRKRKQRLAVKIVVVLLFFVSVFYLFLTVFQPKVDIGDINIGIVGQGSVEVSVYATGKVVPLLEEIITSPVSSKVLEVYKKVGDHVEKDER